VAILASGSRVERLRGCASRRSSSTAKDDPLVPFEAGEDTARTIPGATMLAIEGMGHDMPRPPGPPMIDAICALAARADA
jgi:hypothetical protein